MARAVLLAAFVAGALAGIAISAVQQFSTTPLILQAETLEAAASAPHKHEGAAADAAPHADDHDGPPGFAERLAFGVATNVLLGIGYCLLLAGCFAFHGRPVSALSGTMWGIAGFAVFTLAPGLGLPPELPGMAAADLVARQGWWALAVACTASGLWLAVFKPHPLAKLAAFALLVLPHAVGAPHAPEPTHTVPAELAARFAAASISVSAVFWVIAGWLSGAAYRRFVEPDAAAS